ncbi:MAG: D-arabinono-1,4-lactone oxidase [Nocardioidaceae bacterium]
MSGPSAEVAAWTNWAGNQQARPLRVERPRNTDDLARAITTAVRDGLPVKPIGAGHSFTSIGVTEGVQLDLARCDRVVDVDRSTGLVTVQAGLPLHRLNAHLARHGLAMPNLGDNDRQTIAGALATGTHGTGARLGGLATAVHALQMITADGELIGCSAQERPDVFAAAQIGLGALGVVAAVTLQCVPAFLLHAAEEPMRLNEVLDRVDELADGNDHFEFYWFLHTTRTLTKRNNRVDSKIERQPVGRLRSFVGDELIGNGLFEVVNRLGARQRRLTPRSNAIAARAVAAREYVDNSARVFVSPRRVRFREMEYAIPRERLVAALRAVQSWVDAGNDTVGFPVQVRFAAADDIWLSTGYDRANAYIAVRQYHRIDPRAYFAAVEAIMNEHEGRPHWGTLHSQHADTLRPRYPRFDDFLAVRRALDPEGVFGNDYLDTVLGPAGTT